MEATSTSPKPSIDDRQVKLYGILIDQLHKYGTIQWQFPMAFVAANSFALNCFFLRPEVLFFLSVLDSMLVYAFHRSLVHQQSLIHAIQAVEDRMLKTEDAVFVPQFTRAKFKAAHALEWSLWIITLGIAAYAVHNALFAPDTKVR